MGAGEVAMTSSAKQERPLRIGVNALQIQPGRALSVGIYLRSLLEGVARVDAHNEYLIFVSPGTAGRFDLGRPNLREVVCKGTGVGRPVRILYEQAVLPRVLRRLGVDVFFSPENSAPLRLPCRSVLGLQMMMMFTMPECFPRSKRGYFRYIMRRAAPRADRVVCVSASIAKEAQQYLGVPPSKTTVIHEAPAPCFRPMPLGEAQGIVESKYSIGGDYFLAVATMAPYKNLLRIVEAYAKARKTHGVAEALVVAGGEGEWPGYRQQVLSAVEREGVAESVRFIGQVPQEDLLPLYSAAVALVFPSLCESFGLPVVEAMACGCPVITSNYSCLPETAGGAALLVDPFSSDSIAAGIASVASSPSLQRDLRQRGLARAARLSWEDCGRRLVTVFQQVCGVADRPGI